MASGIDHVIICCVDPDAAVEELCGALGLLPGGGGRHETSGTFNRLVWFGDSYLELVGVFDRELAEQGLFGRHIVRLLDGPRRRSRVSPWQLTTWLATLSFCVARDP